MATRKGKKKTKTARVGAAVAAGQEQLLDTVNEVWLAGLGAVAKTQRGAPKLFDELVKEGARVHAQASKAADKAVRSVLTRAQSAIEGRVGSARAKAAETLENLEKIFQARLQRALHQMGVPGSRDIARLTAQVEALNANVEKLARRRGNARSGGARQAAANVTVPH